MPSKANYRAIIGDGLWRNNTGFVQLLGLCPLLVISNTVVNALGLGLATVLVFFASNVTVIGLALLIALKNCLDSLMRRRTIPKTVTSGKAQASP